MGAMKKILFSAACLMLPLSTWSQGPAIRPIPKSPIPSTSPPGHLKTVLTSYEGYIEIQKAGQDARERVISVPQTLRGGDRVHTYRKGSAVIQFKDGSQVRLGPYTIFTVEEDTPAKISINITLGRLWAVVAKVRSREFQVQTPTAVAAVRGTTFGVEVLSQARTTVMVAEGQVGVRGMAGDELLLNANQRVEVLQDRMTRPERFEGKPEGMREEKDPKGEDEEEDSKGSKGDREHGDKMRQAMEREVGFQLGRDAIESAAAFEMKNAVYEEGKTVIDVFGKRVRVEEYITRPDPATFKFVTLNFRDDRLDHSFLEVVANKPLPQDLGLMGNLWFHHTSNPEWYAIKQRWVISNTQDSLVHLMVDGSPQEFQFMSSVGPVRFYPTVFGNVYEFINGDPVALNKIWSENYRPFSSTLLADFGLRAASSLMIHAQPVQMAERWAIDPDGAGGVNINQLTGNKWWDYAPITFNGALGSTGKFSFDHGFAPEPGLTHFVRIRHFINFVDTNSNGILDFGEYSDGRVYHDKVARITNGLPLPGSPTPIAGAGTYDSTGDRDFFSDLNNNNVLDLNPLVEPKLQAVNYSLFEPEIFFRELMMKVANEPRDWLREDHFTFNDEGKVIDFRALSASADTQEGMQNIFETLNFERVTTSSKFEGRKIDLVTTPHFMMEAGMLHHEPPHDDAGDVQKTPI